MDGWKGRGTLALVFLLVVSLVVTGPALFPASTRTPSRVFPVRTSATAVTIRAIYADSQYFEVNWSRSTDACFGSYTFNFTAASSYPTWTVSSSTMNIDATAFSILGLTAGTTYYYEVADTDCGGQSATTPVWVFTEPNPGTVTYSWVNDTAVRLHWTNNYSYGGTGHLVFVAYGVEYSGNHTVITSWTNVAETNYTFTAPAPGTYALDVLTADECDQCNPMNPPIFASNSVSFTTTAPVTATASAAGTTYEVGVPVSFTCTAASGVGPYTYAWTFGDGATASTANPTHTYVTAGTLDAACTATDAHSGTAVSHVSLAMNPGISVAATASSTSIAPGSAVIFNVTASGGTGGPYTITWNFGDGSTGTGLVATHTYTTAGTYIPTVTVTDTLGGSTTKTLPSITVGTPSAGGTGDLALYAGIGAIAVIAAIAVAFLLMRKKKRGPANPPGATPPPSP